MPQPWPPPPDLASIQELVRAADIECLIETGAPADEYSLEEDKLFATLHHLPTAELLPANILPHLERIWQRSFSLDEAALTQRRPQLVSLANEITRFFGPQAQPQTRRQT